MSRTIDHDIELYEISMEHDTAMLCRSHPTYEAYWHRRIHATRLVIATLESLRRAIDAQPKPVHLFLER